MINQPKINVNLNDAEDLICESCGSTYFKQVYRVKKLSALMSPTGEEMMAPIPLLSCLKCSQIMNNIA